MIRAAGSVVLWLCITPLGLPVVPEVNATRITSSASMAAAANFAADALPRGHVVETFHTGARGVANDADRRECGQPRLELSRHGGMIEVAKHGAADQHFAVGEAHDVFELAIENPR